MLQLMDTCEMKQEAADIVQLWKDKSKFQSSRIKNVEHCESPFSFQRLEIQSWTHNANYSHVKLKMVKSRPYEPEKHIRVSDFGFTFFFNYQGPISSWSTKEKRLWQVSAEF